MRLKLVNAKKVFNGRFEVSSTLSKEAELLDRIAAKGEFEIIPLDCDETIFLLRADRHIDVESDLAAAARTDAPLCRGGVAAVGKVLQRLGLFLQRRSMKKA
jgi:hypothetical protein